MSEDRELEIQGRAERGESLAQASDQPVVTESIRRRHASQRKDGMHTTARSVRGPAKALAGDARFDEDGNEIEKVGEFDCCDRYLATKIGTESAAHALQIWRQQRDSIRLNLDSTQRIAQTSTGNSADGTTK